jgi:hypothetical protein
LPGTVAIDADPGESAGFAHDLAEFIRDVRAIDTRGRVFAGGGRGRRPARPRRLAGDLLRAQRAAARRAGAAPGVGAATGVAQGIGSGRDEPRRPDPRQRAGVGRAAGRRARRRRPRSGDPALDLVGAWHLLEPGPRQALRDDLGSSDVEWERGRARAFVQAMGAVWYYVDGNPPMSRMGRRTLERVVAS